MNRTERQQLIDALIKAREAATEAGLLGDDGGTCNFDSPMLYTPKGTREATMNAIGEAAGVRFMRWEHWPFTSADYSAWIVYGNFERGQGEQRTRIAEAFAESLKAAGYKSDVYYQMD